MPSERQLTGYGRSTRRLGTFTTEARSKPRSNARTDAIVELLEAQTEVPLGQEEESARGKSWSEEEL